MPLPVKNKIAFSKPEFQPEIRIRRNDTTLVLLGDIMTQKRRCQEQQQKNGRSSSELPIVRSVAGIYTERIDQEDWVRTSDLPFLPRLHLP